MTPATPELHALQDLCSRLERETVPYMLTGSLAMAYYARPRMTRDIDLVVALGERDAATLLRALDQTYHVDADALAEALRLRRPSGSGGTAEGGAPCVTRLPRPTGGSVNCSRR